jgi:hypothetical protein
VLDDRTTGNPPDVDEVPRDGVPGRRQFGEQRHGRRHVAPVHREVHDDEITLSHHAMNARRRVVQIAVECRERLPQAVAALRSCGVLDEVLCDQIEC